MSENNSNVGLLEQLFRVVLLLNRYHHHNRGDREHFGDPHRGQGRVLALLKLKPEITQRELTYLLNMRNQSLGELLTKLERNGFITRFPSEEDRRVMNVKLTEAGAEAANQADQRQQSNGKVFECLDDEEQEKLGEYLNRLIEELQKQLGDAEPFDREREDDWEGRGSHRHPHGPHGRHGGSHGPHGPHGRGNGEFRFRRWRGAASFDRGHGRSAFDGRFGDSRRRPERGPEQE